MGVMGDIESRSGGVITTLGNRPSPTLHRRVTNKTEKVHIGNDRFPCRNLFIVMEMAATLTLDQGWRFLLQSAKLPRSVGGEPWPPLPVSRHPESASLLPEKVESDVSAELAPSPLSRSCRLSPGFP
jgi:hypothetical protein